MKRDLKEIVRDLEDKRSNDIIYKKHVIKKTLLEDPDIQEVLGKMPPRPLNKFADPDHPTEQELEKRKEILAYNDAVKHPQIVPYLKLNGIQKEVLNFIMFDIDDNTVSYTNQMIKTQYIIIMCLVHEDDMETEYGIIRTDLLSYLVKDLFNWSNVLGKQAKLINDFNDIIDSKYYCRTLKFEVQAPNIANQNYRGMSNKHDVFTV